jgi:hypothetical protein
MLISRIQLYNYRVILALRWIGENTPRKRKSCSDIWKYVKRLKPGNPFTEEGNTHICVASIPEDGFGRTVCNQPLKLYNCSKCIKSSCITTRALEHMAKYHKDTELSKDYDDSADIAHGSKVEPQLRAVVCFVILCSHRHLLPSRVTFFMC